MGTFPKCSLLSHNASDLEAHIHAGTCDVSHKAINIYIENILLLLTNQGVLHMPVGLIHFVKLIMRMSSCIL